MRDAIDLIIVCFVGKLRELGPEIDMPWRLGGDVNLSSFNGGGLRAQPRYLVDLGHNADWPRYANYAVLIELLDESASARLVFDENGP